MNLKEAVCEEFTKFEMWLKDNNIDYSRNDTDSKEYAIARLHFYFKNKFWSVIHGYGTYGGTGLFEEDPGLLEAYDFIEEPVGFLTAEEVVKLINGEVIQK